MQKLAKKWIQKAIKHEGALHKQLGVPEDKKIPASKLNAAAEKGGKLGQRARLAKTLKKLGGEEPTMRKAGAQPAVNLNLRRRVRAKKRPAKNSLLGRNSPLATLGGGVLGGGASRRPVETATGGFLGGLVGDVQGLERGEHKQGSVTREMGRIVAHEALVKQAKDKALETFVKLAVSFAEDAGLTKRQIEDMLVEKMAEFEETAGAMEKAAWLTQPGGWFGREFTPQEKQMQLLSESMKFGKEQGLPPQIAYRMAMSGMGRNTQQAMGWQPPGAKSNSSWGGWGGPATGGGQPIDYSGGGNKSLYGRDTSKLFARAGYDPRGHQQMMDSLQALQFGGLNRQTRGQELAALARMGTGMGLI